MGHAVRGLGRIEVAGVMAERQLERAADLLGERPLRRGGRDERERACGKARAHQAPETATRQTESKCHVSLPVSVCSCSLMDSR